MKRSSTSTSASANSKGSSGPAVGDEVLADADHQRLQQHSREILIVKAVTKALKKKEKKKKGDRTGVSTMDLVELLKVVQKKLGGGADAIAVTMSELRAALESAPDKVEMVGATAVQLISKKDKKKRKLPLMSPSEEDVATGSSKKEEKKKKRRKEGGGATLSTSSSSVEDGDDNVNDRTDAVRKWRTRNKVVVMVEPSPSSHDSSSSNRSAKAVKDSHLIPFQTFDDLAQVGNGNTVPKALLEALTSRFQTPSPIQAQSWPILMNRHNLVGIAETGSGKTLGFCLPALIRLSQASSDDNTRTKRRPVRMLVLSPTRELAMQSHEVLHEYGQSVGIMSLVVYGGVSKVEQEKSIRNGNVDAIVATPGRLKDLLMGGTFSSSNNNNNKGRNHHRGNSSSGGGGGVLDLSHVQYLVLDEADRMLDLGFFPDVQYIVGQCTHHDRQTCLFSATWPASIQQMAASLLHPPTSAEGTNTNPRAPAATVRVYVGFETIVKDADEDATSSASANAAGSASDAAVVVVDDALSANKRVKQTIEVMEDHQRDGRLRTLLSEVPKTHAHGEPHRVLVFCLYKKEAERLEHRLRQSGHRCTSIHGNKAQSDRTQALDKFKTGEIPLLIATDVAARGLHIPNVYMVINYTFPLTIEDYVHRIGRTGRAGQSGLSVTFFQPQQDKARAGELQQVLRQAGQDIPEALARFGSTIKKKEHKLYGNFGPSSASSGPPMKQATRITFNYSDDEADN